MIFQNPQGGIDPRRSARQVIAEPLIAHSLVSRAELTGRVEELMQLVGFDPGLSDRRLHQLSAGQCQRLAIARCLGLGAELLICAEPTSALDVSVQAQIVNLLRNLQRLEGASYLLISARPCHGAPAGPPRRLPLSRPDRRVGAGRASLHRPVPSVHDGADALGPPPAAPAGPSGADRCLQGERLRLLRPAAPTPTSSAARVPRGFRRSARATSSSVITGTSSSARRASVPSD